MSHDRHRKAINFFAMKRRILVVEDEPALQFLIASHLRRHGDEVIAVASAEAARDELSGVLPDLVLLDWMLPGRSGVDFLRQLRQDERTRRLPVIMLTARAEEDDKVRGLSAGADDYLTKPFSPRELSARIDAVLRRAAREDVKDEVIEIGGLRLDRAAHRVSADGRVVHLPPSEYRLLEFLMLHPERVVSRERLLAALWGDATEIEERTIDVHVRRLRSALAGSGHDRLIQTVRGSGYRFSQEPVP